MGNFPTLIALQTLYLINKHKNEDEDEDNNENDDN